MSDRAGTLGSTSTNVSVDRLGLNTTRNFTSLNHKKWFSAFCPVAGTSLKLAKLPRAAYS